MIPKLRFPEFTDNWTVTELGECSDIQTGKALSSSDILEFGDRLICRGINVKSGFLESNSEINRFTNSSIDRKYLVQSGDILLPMDGSKVGKNIAVADLEFHNSFLIQRVARIRLPKELVWFYFQQLWSWNFERYVFTINTSSGIPHISEKQIRKFKVSKPSLQEAQKISSLFELVNKKINLLTKKKENLETYKKGLMQKLFSQELRFKREDGTDYPNWEAKHLGELCSITTGKLDANAQVEDGRYLFFTCAKEVFRIDEYAFEGASLLISGNGANVGYIHNYEGRFNAYQRTYVLQNIGVNRYYLQYYLEQNLQRRIHREKKDGNTPYIVMSTLTMMKIALPSENEANKIAKAMMTIDESLEQLTNKLNSTVALKKGLLQQMFV
jgi:type I restriction enzyme S subunit